jgi:hypothetical protein
MSPETAITVVLLFLLLFFSTNLEKRYAPGLQAAGKHPFVRFAAGLLVVYTATVSPLLAMLALLVVFFWIGDVHISAL